MLTINPISGYALDTVFTASFSSSAHPTYINWGDGSINSFSTSAHIYSAANEYTIFVTDCSSTSSFFVSVYPSAAFTNDIIITYDTLTAYAGCSNTLTLNISSTTPITTVLLYSSGNSSLAYSGDSSFWAHLTPTWGFYNSENDAISELSVSCSPFYSGATLLGYTAISAITYKDDMPGNSNLFFTLHQEEAGVKINSRAYAAINFTTSAAIPNRIAITSDGLRPINNIQWADHTIPYLTSIYNDTLSCSNIMHYASGYLTDVAFVSDCYGIAPEHYRIILSEVNPYAIQNFFLPSSALPPDDLIISDIECGDNPYEREIIRKRNTPIQVSISASGVFNVNGSVYTLTGISDKFNIYPFEQFHDFYRNDEDRTVYDLLAKFSHVNLNELPTFNSYLSAVCGEGDSLGKAYDKIQNFSKDHTDIDICQIDSIYDMAEKLNVDIENFGLQFPQELERVMNFFSVPLQKLIGARCKCNTNFVQCNNACEPVQCSMCGFNKKSNLGRQLTLNDTVTAGSTLLYRENGSSNYNYLPIKSQNNINIYPLTTLTAYPIFDQGLSNFCIFEWDQTPQNNPVEGIINYKDYRNNLSPTLSSVNDWYDEDGIIEETLNYILTKNLLPNGV